MVIDVAGEIFGELPRVAARAQAVSEPSTQMIATQQRQIPGPLVTEERGSPELKSVRRSEASSRSSIRCVLEQGS
jgi:hypothetical protein